MTKSNGLWAGHSGFYLRHRAYLSSLLESDGGWEGGMVECMMPSLADLEFHADSLGANLECVGNHPHARLLKRADAIEQLWVRASDKNGYRPALLEMLRRDRTASTELHEAAVKMIETVATGVRNSELRSKLSGNERAAVCRRLETEKAKHANALRAAVPEPALFTFLDSTLDADHVFSSSALSPIEEAWVWLFPVPANANRGFGARVESKYLKVDAESATRYLTAEMICKLLMDTMPTSHDEIPETLRHIGSQLDSAVWERFESRAESILRTFIRD